jgi:uncharacterized protein with GYD domain
VADEIMRRCRLTIDVTQHRIEVTSWKESAMGYYLVQAAYTADAWSTLVGSPQDRSEPVREMVEDAGGSLKAFYLAFGDFDVVAIVELPDDATAAAVSIATSAAGAVRAIKTTPLITPEDAVRALAKAKAIAYQPPTPDIALQTPMHAG